MTTNLRKWFPTTLGLAVAGIAVLGSTPSAHATLTLSAQETTGVLPPILLVVDGGAGDADGTVNNVIVLQGPGGAGDPITFGDFSVLGSVSKSNSPGSAFGQVMSNSLDVTNTTSSSQSVILKISDTDFTSPAYPVFDASANGQFNASNSSTTGSVLGSSVQALAFADFTNTLFGTQNTIQDFSFNAGNFISDSYNNSVHFVPASTAPAIPYSMTVQLNFTLAGDTMLSNRGDSITATPAPEPATMAMVLAGLPMVGFVTWRRRRKSV